MTSSHSPLNKKKSLLQLITTDNMSAAIQFVKNNFLQDGKELSDILLSIYKTDDLDVPQFCHFIDEALKNIKHPMLTKAVIRLSKEKRDDDLDIPAMEAYLNGETELDSAEFYPSNALIQSLLLYGASSEINPLIDKEFLSECYKDFLSDEQDGLSAILVNIGLEEKSTLSSEQQIHLNNVIFDVAIETYNAALFKKLAAYEMKNNRGSAFQEKINQLEPHKKDLAKFLLTLTKQNDFHLVSQRMNQFSKEKFGNISYEGGLLTCVATADRKTTYDFNPTVLDSIDQLNEYFKTLLATPPPHRERFIIAGTHWICGDIQITAEGKVSVLFIDSLGLTRLEDYDTAAAIEKCKMALPHANIYFPDLKKQYGGLGCSVFALDDARHLYTVDHHLDARYKNLHDYVEDSAKQKKPTESKTIPETIQKYGVQLCDLPLSMLRSMQSPNLLQEVIPGRSEAEQKIPINKKQELIAENAPRFFSEGKNSRGETRLMNRRLEYTLNKMEKSNLAFLKKVHDETSINNMTAPFTLMGFEKRMADKKAKAILTPKGRNV